MSEAAVLGEHQQADPRLTTAAGLAALGIVDGNLGTSPLDAMPAVLGTVGQPDCFATLGVLSLIVWALIVTISIKYCVFVMRADNRPWDCLARR